MSTTPPLRSRNSLVALSLAASLAASLAIFGTACSGDDDDESPPADSEAPADVDGDDGNGALDGDGDDGEGALDGSIPSSDG
jgi:hypothetical protein